MEIFYFKVDGDVVNPLRFITVCEYIYFVEKKNEIGFKSTSLALAA